MTYKVYIKQDYKAKIAWGSSSKRGLAAAGVLALVASIFSLSAPTNSDDATPATQAPRQMISETYLNPINYPSGLLHKPELTTADEREVMENLSEPVIHPLTESIKEHPIGPDWQKVTVKKGDSLSRIFKRLSLSPKTLHEIMITNEHSRTFKNILPGQSLRFAIKDGHLDTMEYDIDFNQKLVVKNIDDRITVELEEIELEKKIRHASATITSSLYLAGQEAGLTDKLIMQLVTIYGWDIDFALNIRKGDHFSVMYEEYFKDGVKVEDGAILAAEFGNRGNHFKAVRFVHEDGDTQYYSDTGHSMRKAFLRTPVKFSRISSGFNLRRKHPILNKIRAHRGVDYSAPTGTPVKATGDGIITYRGTKGGYGRTVAIRHGSTYSTLYAHLSRYGKNSRHGTRVKQGQIIGYVGSTGLATGPHLHYEFQVHGVHRNPLTVKLPKAMKIPDELMDEFISQTTPLLAQLDNFSKQTDFAGAETSTQTDLIAMNKETPSSTTTR